MVWFVLLAYYVDSKSCHERQRREAPGKNAVELELNEGSHDVEELVHLLAGQVGQDLSEGSTDALNDHVLAEDDDEREDLVEHLELSQLFERR